jgi:hypothetical protein
MARRKKPAESGYLLYDVIYEDGSRSSNRKIPTGELDPFDRDGSVLALLEGQERKIAEASGRARSPIKSVNLSSS